VLQGPISGKCARSVHVDSSFNCPNDLMQLLSQSQTAPFPSSSAAAALFKVSVYSFPIVATVSSIPVFSIVIKYNLIENGFSDKVGFLWGVLFPWLAALPLIYQPNMLAQFVNISSLIFVSFTDFIVPFALYIVLMREQRRDDRSRTFTASLQSSVQSTRTGLLGPSAGEAFRNVVGATDAEPVNRAADDDVPKQLAAEGGDDGAMAMYGAHTMSSDHDTFPGWKGGRRSKSACAVTLGTALAVLAVVATVLTIIQGQYKIDQQVCSLVGS